MKIRQDSGEDGEGGDEELGAGKGKRLSGHGKQVIGLVSCPPGKGLAFDLTSRGPTLGIFPLRWESSFACPKTGSFGRLYC